MNRFIFSCCLLVAMGRLAMAQPSSVYVNNGTFVSPPAIAPQVDATTFINNGSFTVGFNDFGTNTSTALSSLIGAILFSSSISPFEFSDVQNYTNRGFMSCDTGFTFDNAPSLSGFRHMSASFGNANTGVIQAGSSSNSFTSSLVFFAGPGLSFLTGVPNVTVSATNLVNTGLMDVGTDGLLTMNGMNVNLSRGTLHVEGFDDAGIVQGVNNIGIFDRYWGIGSETNEVDLGNLILLPPFSPESPINIVTNSSYQPSFSIVAPPNATAYANRIQVNESNITWQVVYINTNLTGISTDVRFIPTLPFAIPLIQWQAVITNTVGGPNQFITNNLYLSDEFGVRQTNFLITNIFSFSGVPQPQPFNYTFSRSYASFATGNFLAYTNLPTANSVPFDPTTIFAGAFPATNDYSAYGVQISPVTSFPDATLPGSTVTNTPGRIRVTAGTSLDLTGAKITGPNYLNLTSTNHFVGSANAIITSPFMDVNVGSTNGQLTVTNLVAPFVPRFDGPIDMWSGRWTNIIEGVTNTYHVLMVNAQITPTATPLVLNAAFRATNVVISDQLNINQTLLINAQNLTITSNAVDSATAYGQINVLSPDIIWSSSLPVLQSLTNFGLISTFNTTYFLGVRQSPYYTTNFDEPYLSFVNHGTIFSSGNSMWASNFENTGLGLIITNSGVFTNVSSQSALIYSSTGPINLQANNALMIGGTFEAPQGDISILANNLIITNHPLIASGSISIGVSNSLTDGGASSGNFWQAGDGINLFVKPVTGDFLGTTVTLTAPAGLEVDNTWAGADLGPSVAGFSNNGALGHLILDGGDIASQFFFSGLDASTNYALYVDQIELRNGATNRATQNGAETFTAFDIDPSLTIYFADATIGGFDISEKLNGADGGRLVWVPAFAGIFSGTNFVYPSGNTYRFNRALAISTDIDSNENGIANAFDPSPIYTSDSVNLSVTLTNVPKQAPVISWSTLARTTNYLYYKSGPAVTNWTMITNFVQGAQSGVVSVIDHGRTNSAGYYRVKVNGPLPY